MITSPVAKTDDLHIDYIDWIRFYGEYMISKVLILQLSSFKRERVFQGSDGMLKIFRFGNFGEENFLKNCLKPETRVIRLAELDLPDTNIWFLRTELDPLNKVGVVSFSLSAFLKIECLHFICLQTLVISVAACGKQRRIDLLLASGQRNSPQRSVSKVYLRKLSLN